MAGNDCLKLVNTVPSLLQSALSETHLVSVHINHTLIIEDESLIALLPQ